VYVINLDSRPDRWETIKKICYSCGIHPQRVSAIKASPGWHGCGKSHVKVAELAESRGEPWYILIEDDATFTLDDWRRFLKLLPTLWGMRESWDVFNGGPGTIADFELIQRDPILYKIKANLAHFLLVNSSGYPIIKAWAPEKEAIDEYLKQHSRMLGTYPYISAQAVGISDIGIGDPVSTLNYAQEAIKKHLIDSAVIEKFLSFRRGNI
jgi:hypothetical protein